MKTFAKVVIVVFLSALVGIRFSNAIFARVDTNGNVVTTTRTVPGAIVTSTRGPSSAFEGQKVEKPSMHRTFSLSEFNHGKHPGELGVVGTFRVFAPNKVGNDYPFVVMVRVRDMDQNLVVDWTPIGEGVDFGGKANWSQDFSGTFYLARGRYVVDMWAMRPGLVSHTDKETGEQVPATLGKSGRRMIVY